MREDPAPHPEAEPSVLGRSIWEAIGTESWSFDRFMARALYDSVHGFYVASNPVGRQGHFLTSPSLSGLFGDLLADQVAEVWQILGCPARFDLVEAGAHHGVLASDILRTLQAKYPALWDATKLWLIEPLDLLRKQQQASLSPPPRGIEWVADPSDFVPRSLEGFFYANELFDSLPVRVLRFDGREWLERRVARGDRVGEFVWVDSLARGGELASEIKKLPLPQVPDYTTEICLGAPAWAAAITHAFGRGILLAIDYGMTEDDLYRPERIEGTLRTYRDHRTGLDPLARPGEQDLTTDVNFTALARSVRLAGGSLLGFTDQHHFLINVARERLENWDATWPPTDAQKFARAFQTLAHPTMMGSRFKVMGWQTGLASSARIRGLGCPQEEAML